MNNLINKGMYIIGTYRETDLMSDLICDNYQMLLIMKRFDIPLGFGDKTIDEVCCDNNVDTKTFLTIVNMLVRRLDIRYRPMLDGVSIKDLLIFLRNTHEYYSTSRLPAIRDKLLNVLADDKISTLLLRYFDDYAQHINEHFQKEEINVFPYIERLIKGEKSNDYSINMYRDSHEHIEESLKEFKNVMIKYYKGNNEEAIISIIHDLWSCAGELEFHTYIEDDLLVPLIIQLENR